eukprot:403334658
MESFGNINRQMQRLNINQTNNEDNQFKQLERPNLNKGEQVEEEKEELKSYPRRGGRGSFRGRGAARESGKSSRFVKQQSSDEEDIFTKYNRDQNVRNFSSYLERLEDLKAMIQVFDILLDKFRSQADMFPIANIRSYVKDELPFLKQRFDIFGNSQGTVNELNLMSKQLKEKKKNARVLIIQEKFQNQQIKQERRVAAQNRDEEYKLQPPDDFQNISIIPTLQELTQPGKPFIRPIPAKGGRFRDAHDYLDLIFRLLREDAIDPLRRGLKLMQKSVHLNQKEFKNELRNSGCRLFDNVTVNDVNITRVHQGLTMKLRIHDDRTQNWVSSKRLLAGSLLMMSNDNFKSINFCIVVERDQRRMTETQRINHFADITVELILQENEAQNSDSSDEEQFNIRDTQDTVLDFYLKNKGSQFKMIESTAYFESYKHVLQKLKDMDKWEDLPFKKYLIGDQSQNIDEPKLMGELDMQNKLMEFYQSVNFGIQQAKFDQSQTKAVRTCLYKELAIIQGPPGTGKTYVGEHYVRLMIENRDLWREKKGPILLVCYTNHALDQFLNLISKYTQSFLRFGGRCKDEVLKQHQIREYIKNKGIKYPRSYGETIQQINEISEQFTSKKINFQLDSMGIIHSQITNEGAVDLVEDISEAFKKQLIQVLRQMQQENTGNKQAKEIHKKVTQYFNNIITKDQDVCVLFWLGLIDVQLYAQDVWIRTQFGTMDFEDFNDDDVDQRELDQFIDDEEDMIVLSKEKKRMQEKLQEKYNLLTQLYNYKFHNPFYGSSKTIEECFQQGKRYQAVYPQSQFFEPFNLSLQQRWSLNNYYCKNKNDVSSREITELLNKYERLFKQRKQLDQMTQVKAIAEVDIVAMTTTGCAKFNDILKNQNFSIVIVEEAAEVFEAHILTALSEKTEQLVLIGDHQQLRPSPAVFELEKNYNLSMSLFERLVKNNFEYVTLSNQRRMRPEISEMIRFLYPNLEDDARVKTYPSIKGIEKSVYFFDHENEEVTDEGNMSKMNKFEAEMIEKFIIYLLQQSYDPEKITILSLYMAQSSFIKRNIQRYPKEHPARKVKVITVDNFQGEENDIIILSLVRSNQRNEIGYLKVSNRVCVALSRAKHGMFIFGNASCLYKYVDQQNKRQFANLEDQSQLWVKVLEYLKKNDFIGQTLNLCCVNHKAITKVKVPSDFQNVPEGGCKLPCGIRMECGHTCESLCHYYEQTLLDKTGHNKYKCLKSCERVHKCGHDCSYKCFECRFEQQPCRQTVEKVFARCQHKQKVLCYDQETSKCMSSCKIVKPCGHKCPKYCHQDCSSDRCGENMEKTLPCGHNHELKCFQTPENFVLTDKFGCPKQCGAKLDCGHLCQEKCGECQKKDFHGICKEKVDNVFQCGHINKSTCGNQTMLCQLQCQTKCIHGKCPKKCFEPCVLCMDQCEIKCQHFECKRKCSQPCDKKLCQSRCSKNLKCGHRCVGLCGDICPKVCRLCQPNHEAFEIFFGTEDEDTAKFVVIDCGHILESSSLDQFIETSKKQGQVKFAECPKCKSPIKKCLRYQSQINSTLQDMNRVKEINIEAHSDLMKQFGNLAAKYMQLDNRIQNLAGLQSLQIKQLFQSWYNLFKNAGDNEGLLKNCAIKLELLSFIVAFRVYLEKHEKIYLIQNQALISFCRVSIDRIIKSKFVITEAIKKEMREKAQIVDKEYNFKETADMIVKALGLAPGHYYKCPNGHYYVIGECGGAMEESKCPDCGAKIGGSYHTLASGNLHAGEFDNSQVAAWDPNGFDQQILNGQIDLNQFIQD